MNIVAVRRNDQVTRTLLRPRASYRFAFDAELDEVVGSRISEIMFYFSFCVSISLFVLSVFLFLVIKDEP